MLKHLAPPISLFTLMIDQLFPFSTFPAFPFLPFLLRRTVPIEVEPSVLSYQSHLFLALWRCLVSPNIRPISTRLI